MTVVTHDEQVPRVVSASATSRPADPGKAPAGHLWRWELDPIDASRTRVTHTYDWTRLILAGGTTGPVEPIRLGPRRG